MKKIFCDVCGEEWEPEVFCDECSYTEFGELPRNVCLNCCTHAVGGITLHETDRAARPDGKRPEIGECPF